MKHQEFTSIIKANEGIIYKLTKIYTDSIEDKKDLYQEVVYQLWKSFPSFKGTAQVSTWMYRVALNTAIKFLNEKKRSQKTSELPDNIVLYEEQYDTTTEQQLHIMYRCIKQLHPADKGLVFLYLEGKSHAEIAAITGFSTSNVGTRLSRVKEKIKKQLKQ